MKEVFVNHSLNYLKNNNACDEKQEKIFKYTLESLYSFLTKSLIILLMSLFFNTFLITFLSLLFYSILRGFAFGIHATKNLYCWIISLSVYVIIPFIISHYQFSLPFIYTTFVIGLIAILLWSPADTKARPLINKKKRIVNKCITLFISLIYIGLSILLDDHNLKEIVSIVLLTNLVCTCPITYYLFGQPYRNYLTYKKVK